MHNNVKSYKWWGFIWIITTKIYLPCTGDIDTLEILSPFSETNIFMNSNLFSCVDKRVTNFSSSGDLLPNLSQTLY